MTHRIICNYYIGIRNSTLIPNLKWLLCSFNLTIRSHGIWVRNGSVSNAQWDTYFACLVEEGELEHKFWASFKTRNTYLYTFILIISILQHMCWNWWNSVQSICCKESAGSSFLLFEHFGCDSTLICSIC